MRAPLDSYRRPATAFVRGKTIGGWLITLDESHCRRPLDDLVARLGSNPRRGTRDRHSPLFPGPGAWTGRAGDRRQEG
jgi:hypothetical protein